MRWFLASIGCCTYGIPLSGQTTMCISLPCPGRCCRYHTSLSGTSRASLQRCLGIQSPTHRGSSQTHLHWMYRRQHRYQLYNPLAI
uniref:Uncharacterized protein n=1 Tax=Rhizophora mucronata TaxID=61149 RepID=A0A2P2NIN1_RHIMU